MLNRESLTPTLSRISPPVLLIAAQNDPDLAARAGGAIRDCSSPTDAPPQSEAQGMSHRY